MWVVHLLNSVVNVFQLAAVGQVYVLYVDWALIRVVGLYQLLGLLLGIGIGNSISRHLLPCAFFDCLFCN